VETCLSALPAEESSDREDAFGRLACCPYTANMTFANSDNRRAWPTSYIKKCVISCQNIRPKTHKQRTSIEFCWHVWQHWTAVWYSHAAAPFYRMVGGGAAAAAHRSGPIPFNTSPVSSLKSHSLSVAVLERIYCWYVTLRCDLELWPRDLDLWPWTLNICSVPAVPYSNSVRNLSSIRQVIAVWTLTLWPWTCVPRVALCSEIVYTKLKLVMSRYDLDLWPVDLESLW